MSKDVAAAFSGNFVLLGGILLAAVLVLIWTNWKKKRSEKDERKSVDSREKSAFSSDGTAVSTGPETESRMVDEKETKSAVKYGRGFAEREQPVVHRPPRETEEFYSYRRKGHEKFACPCCGVENLPGAGSCILCGAELNGEN